MSSFQGIGIEGFHYREVSSFQGVGMEVYRGVLSSGVAIEYTEVSSFQRVASSHPSRKLAQVPSVDDEGTDRDATFAQRNDEDDVSRFVFYIELP